MTSMAAPSNSSRRTGAVGPAAEAYVKTNLIMHPSLEAL